MFYRLYNLYTRLMLLPEDMAQLANDDFIMALVVQKLEGRCFADHGYLLKVLSSASYEIGDPLVTSQGCELIVKFDALTFRANKGEIMDMVVGSVSEKGIEGSVGPARVLVPRAYIDSRWVLRREYGAYVDSLDDQSKIEKEAVVRFEVHESKVKMGHELEVIGKMTRNHLGPVR